MLAGWRGANWSALAESVPNLDGDLGSLEPGQFIWDPERAPEGPVAIIVSIPKQLVFVYRNGILIGVSTCSTGKPGHSTPAGVFAILDKAEVHTSATYGEPMPDMEKLTWRALRGMSAICRAIQTRTAACTCHPISPTTSTPSPKSGRRSSLLEGTPIPRRWPIRDRSSAPPRERRSKPRSGASPSRR
jgi:hypothetical protein